jgi:membrane protein DedA with SNARE-associated domain
VGAALLASQYAEIQPVLLAVCAVAGAVLGDSAGYAIGRKGGTPLLARLGRRFPRHFGEPNVARAARAFERWGAGTVFVGRLIALLRIFAGPLAGVLRMPYGSFFAANLLGGIVWVGGTTAAVYCLGVVAEDWLKRFSWLGLAIAVLVGVVMVLVLNRKSKRLEHVMAQAAAGGPTCPRPAAVAPVEGAADLIQ